MGTEAAMELSDQELTAMIIGGAVGLLEFILGYAIGSYCAHDRNRSHPAE